VARSWGRRPSREGLRIAAIALEGYNQRVHAGLPGASPFDWPRRDALRARRAWDRLRRQGDLVARVVDRALATPELGDRPVPESVLFLRAAVAAGVLCGDVADPVH